MKLCRSHRIRNQLPLYIKLTKINRFTATSNWFRIDRFYSYIKLIQDWSVLQLHQINSGLISFYSSSRSDQFTSMNAGTWFGFGSIWNLWNGARFIFQTETGDVLTDIHWSQYRDDWAQPGTENCRVSQRSILVLNQSEPITGHIHLHINILINEYKRTQLIPHKASPYHLQYTSISLFPYYILWKIIFNLPHFPQVFPNSDHFSITILFDGWFVRLYNSLPHFYNPILI